MMNLTLKINDIKIEVSSELGVNSGLDIHLALQNDPTSLAANHEKIILEISRAQTNPSTSEDLVKEVFSEVTETQIVESEHVECEEEVYYDALDQLLLNAESEHPDSEEEIYYDALDQLPLNTESEHPDSEEEIYYDALDQLPLNAESEHPDSEEEIYYDASVQHPHILECPDIQEEMYYDASDHRTLNLPESERPEEDFHYGATHQLPQNAESHHLRFLNEFNRSSQIANMRLEAGLFQLYELTSSSTGIQRFSTLCAIPWRDILNEIIKTRLPISIKNNLWSFLKELYTLAAKIDRMPVNHQAVIYRHLSPKFDRLFAWLCRLIRNQSPEILNEVRQNILQTRRTLLLFSLFIQALTEIRPS